MEKSIITDFEFHNDDAILNRVLIIALNDCIKIKGHVYSKVLAFDIKSCKLLRLVDTNGSMRGLVYNPNQFVKLKHGDMISVNLKLVLKSDWVNMWRVVSDVEHIECINISAYIHKHVDKIMWNEFKMVNLKKYYRSKRVDTYVNFGGTKVKKYVTKAGDVKYQLKLGFSNRSLLSGGDCFVDLKTPVGKRNLNCIYRGNAIVEMYANNDGRVYSEIEKILGYFRKVNNFADESGSRYLGRDEEYTSADFKKILEMEELYLTSEDEYNLNNEMEEVGSVYDWYEAMEPDKFEEYDYKSTNEEERFGFHNVTSDEMDDDTGLDFSDIPF